MAGGTLGNGGRGRIISEINVTPLVDIMLVLLIIFMVTTTTMAYEAIEVKLPEAATGQLKKVSILAVTIDDKGKIWLNREPSTEAGIRAFIRQERRAGARLEAIIAADKRITHGQVVQIIDLVRAEGVTKFAIHVLKKER